MATELSSNWKKLQAKFKAESTSTSTKRKVEDEAGENTQSAGGRGPTAHARKRQRLKGSDQGHQSPSAPRLKQTATARKSSTKEDRVPPSRPRMGVAQSSKITQGTTSSVSPSLALWAAENDISPEDLAEAYGLGIKNNALLTLSATKPNAGLTIDGFELGKHVAMDCEMVGVGPGGYDSVLARVSIVDFNGRQVYDSFVRPRERVTDWRTAISGVGPKNMATARTFDEVQTQVAELLEGRVLVGHDVQHDLKALELKHPAPAIRDTAKFSGFKKYGNGPKPALRVVAKEVLGVDIQDGQHSSIEDARATMLLFRKHKPQFDSEHLTRYPEPTPQTVKKGTAKPKKKTKKKRRN